jgi:hypothetical protein
MIGLGVCVGAIVRADASMLMSLGSCASGAVRVGGDCVALADWNRRCGWSKHLVFVRKLKLELLCNLEALLGSNVLNDEAIVPRRPIIRTTTALEVQ